MRKLLFLFSFVGLLLGGWYFASPWMAMKSLQEAALEGDGDALKKRVDFSALRDDIKAQVREEITAETASSGSLLKRIGGVIAKELSSGVVDVAVTTAGMKSLVVAGAVASSLIPERYKEQELEWSVERAGFDQFRGISTWEDGSAGPVLKFRRDGIGWMVVGAELQL